MRVSKCCCGCSLKDGCLLLGILGIIGGVGGTIVCIAFEASTPFLEKVVDMYCDNYTASYTVDDTASFCNHDPIKMVQIFFGVYLAVCLIQLIVNSLLVHGARTGNGSLLTPWLVMTGISIVLTIASTCAQMAYIGKTAILSGVISIIVNVVVSGYFLLVVHSHRKEPMEGNLNERQNYGYKY
uniref:Uncharacterized protein n=1 Tax=Acartia pacifica TaxID=335913 RepID=A0A0U2UNP4_ACAPC|nr:hypothetical protein [Acartia pacifica]